MARIIESTLVFLDEGEQRRLEHVPTRTLATGVVAVTYRPRRKS